MCVAEAIRCLSAGGLEIAIACSAIANSDNWQSQSLLGSSNSSNEIAIPTKRGSSVHPGKITMHSIAWLASLCVAPRLCLVLLCMRSMCAAQDMAYMGGDHMHADAIYEWKLILRSDLSPDNNEVCKQSSQICASTLGDFSSGVQVGHVTGTSKFRVGMTGAELSAAGHVLGLRVTIGQPADRHCPSCSVSRQIDIGPIDATTPIDATAFDVSCASCDCPAGGALIAGFLFWSAGRGGCWGSTNFGLTTQGSDIHVICGQGHNFGHFHRSGVDSGVYVFGDECINENEWEETFSMYLLIAPPAPPTPPVKPPPPAAPLLPAVCTPRSIRIMPLPV